MTSRLAERLVILSDACRGLLARLSLLKTQLADKSALPSLTKPEYQKLVKHLLKVFPELNAGERGIPGFDAFRAQSAHICDELGEHYLTLRDAHGIYSASKEALENVGSSLLTVEPSLNFDLLQSFMTLLVSHIRVHVLLGQVGERKLLLAMYGTAYTCVNNSSEESFSELAAYVAGNDDPFSWMRADLSGISVRLGDTLRQLLPLYRQLKDVASMRKADPFNLIARGFATPSDAGKMSVMLLSRHLRDWLLLGYLLIPKELARPEASSALAAALSDGYIVSIFRDATLNVMEQYEALLPSTRGLSIDGKKPKKWLTERSVAVASEAPSQHRFMRTFLLQQMQLADRLLADVPALAEVKAPAIVALLALVRGEVEWYFLHVDAPQPKWLKSKYWNPRLFSDASVVRLMALSARLTGRLLAREAEVNAYSATFLRDCQAGKLDELVVMLQDEGVTGLNSVTDALLAGLTGELSSLAGPPGVEGGLLSVRLNWLRFQVATSTPDAGFKVTPSTKPLLDRMRKVHLLSRLAEPLQKVMMEETSLSEVFWRRTQLDHLFSTTLASDVDVEHIMCFFRIMQDVPRTVHRNCPEDQLLLGNYVTSAIDACFSQVQEAVHAALTRCFDGYQRLHEQVEPIQAAYRLQRLREHKKKRSSRRGGSVEPYHEPLPGYESAHDQRALVADFASHQRRLAALAAALSGVPELVVWNRLYAPPSFLHEAVCIAFSQFLRGTALPSADSIARPSALLAHLAVFVRAMRIVEDSAGLSIGKIVRSTLLRLGDDPAISPVGTVLSGRPSPGDDGIASPIAEWFINMINRDLRPGAVSGIVFSTVTGGYVRVPDLAGRGGSSLEVEGFADATEMEALARLLGPAGVRTVDIRLLGLVRDSVERLKDILVRNRSSLRDFMTEMTTPASRRSSDGWYAICHGMANKEEALQAAITAGHALQLRAMLRTGLRASSGRAVPVLQKAVEMAHEQFQENIYSTPAFVPIDTLADDVGLDIGAADHALKEMLRPFKLNAEDSALWDMLPYLFAACFTSDTWRRTGDFHAATGAHGNNLHVAILAVQKLIYSFQSLDVGSPAAATLEGTLRSFVTVGTYVLLRMKAGGREKFRDFPLRSMFVWMELFVDSVSHVDRSLLERRFPYSLIHSAYIDITLQRKRGAEAGIGLEGFSSASYSREEEKEEEKE
eukprot:PLAT3281.25.p2 GENE.PLAT3281.25~~PLAT3281.25.p2  ORF type:complete len:1183 (-),score=734.57 PLAT3281.25:3837-7385(-)